MAALHQVLPGRGSLLTYAAARHGGQPEYSGPKKRVGAMIAVAEKPSLTILRNFEEGTARMNIDRTRCVIGNPELQIRIPGSEQDCRFTTNHIADNLFRGSKGNIHQRGPVICGRYRKTRCIRIQDKPALKGQQKTEIDDAE